jgi:hypothetical protein
VSGQFQFQVIVMEGFVVQILTIELLTLLKISAQIMNYFSKVWQNKK